jgi:hypothetical protein
MLKIFAVLLTFLLNFNLIAKSTNKIYFYQPEKATLTGKLFLKTFPGPPNYESVRNGDYPERGWYLKLDKKIDVIINEKKRVPENIGDENEKAVDVIQLALPYGEKYEEYKKKKNFKVGARVKLSGTLFRRFTGHHHARVLLSVED